MSLEYYEQLEAECEKLVSILNAHRLLPDEVIRDEQCNPDMFRRHGEYGLWLESLYEALIELNESIPSPVLSQMQSLARRMGIQGQIIP